MAVYLLGPVFGFLLRLRGVTCLHASGVVLANRAVALVGPGGVGKSTTAAAFARLGYPILADDIVALREQGETFLALPGPPRLCLWPQAVNYLYGSQDALPRLTPEDSIDPTYDKRFQALTEEGYRYQSEPLPLAAVYLLSGDRTSAEPRIETPASGEGMLALVANTYRTELLDKTMRSQEFETLGRLVAKVPLRRMIPPADPSQLPRLCEKILKDFQGLFLGDSA